MKSKRKKSYAAIIGAVNAGCSVFTVYCFDAGNIVWGICYWDFFEGGIGAKVLFKNEDFGIGPDRQKQGFLFNFTHEVDAQAESRLVQSALNVTIIMQKITYEYLCAFQRLHINRDHATWILSRENAPSWPLSFFLLLVPPHLNVPNSSTVSLVQAFAVIDGIFVPD